MERFSVRLVIQNGCLYLEGFNLAINQTGITYDADAIQVLEGLSCTETSRDVYWIH